jgi:hypothetical protein
LVWLCCGAHIGVGIGRVGLLAAWLQGLSGIPDKPRGFVFTCY